MRGRSDVGFAFGVFGGKIKDPVEWQRAIREESDRDIYKDFQR